MLIKLCILKQIVQINPHAPVAQKIADEVVFRRFRGEGSSFFKSDLTDSPLRFSMRIFWKIPISALLDFFFQLVLYQDHVLSQMVLKLIRTNDIEKKIMMFIHTDQPLITSFYIKKITIFCRISDESALLRIVLRNGRVRG